MPWCEECAKYWTPNAMNDDGTCPQCGRAVDEPHAHGGVASETVEDEKAPWHFKLLVAATVAYLVWRIVALVT